MAMLCCTMQPHGLKQQLWSKSSEAQNSCCHRWLVTHFLDHMSAGQVQRHVIGLGQCYEETMQIREADLCFSSQ